MSEILACRIRNPGFGIRNTAQGIKNPSTLKSRVQSSTDKDWYPVAGIWNPRRGIQNLRLYWIPFLNMPICTFILSVSVMLSFLLHWSK